MRPFSLFALLNLSLLSSGVFGQPIPGMDRNLPPIDFGDRITDSEELTFIKALETRNWRLSPSLREIAAKLPMNSKSTVYDHYKTDGPWGLLNPWGGMGSFRQGDTQTGLIALVGVLSYGGAFLIADSKITPTSTKVIWTATAAAAAAGGMLYGLIRPWFFADERNKLLRALLFSDDPSLKNP
jgi:hypothetical protein